MKENKSDVKAIASYIRKIRDYRNYTQDYLAAKLGISQNAYSKIELGYSKITLDRLFDIAKILEVEVNDILYFDTDKYSRRTSFG